MLTPNSVGLVDAERGYLPITFREWNRAANRAANWLASLGVGKGDLVAMLCLNCVEYLDIWFACGKLGAIMQTLNWRLNDVFGERWLLIFGAVYILIVLFFPYGLVGTWRVKSLGLRRAWGERLRGVADWRAKEAER